MEEGLIRREDRLEPRLIKLGLIIFYTEKEKRKMGLKIYITKASDWNFGEIRNYNSLEACVEELLSGDYYFNNSPELVISKPRDWMKKSKECDYVVEIYDTWRE